MAHNAAKYCTEDLNVVAEEQDSLISAQCFVVDLGICFHQFLDEVSLMTIGVLINLITGRSDAGGNHPLSNVKITICMDPVTRFDVMTHLKRGNLTWMDNISFRFSNVIYGDKTVRQQMDEIMGDAQTAGTQVDKYNSDWPVGGIGEQEDKENSGKWKAESGVASQTQRKKDDKAELRKDLVYAINCVEDLVYAINCVEDLVYAIGSSPSSMPII
ncbi:hypothetical protein STEG23_002113 [Scotinomys teguina]